MELIAGFAVGVSVSTTVPRAAGAVYITGTGMKISFEIGRRGKGCVILRILYRSDIGIGRAGH